MKRVKIESKKGIIHEFESSQKLMNVLDNRDCHPVDLVPVGLWLSTDLHISFFESLTVQISPQIYEKVGRVLPPSFFIAFPDRYFIKGNNIFYLEIYLTNRRGYGDYIWIKCFADLSKIDLSKENELVFELCSMEETKECCEIRFLRNVNPTNFWTEDLRRYLKMPKKSNCVQEFESPMDIQYPDVTINCFFDFRITNELRNAVFQYISDFIDDWNTKKFDGDQIHECALCDGVDDNCVSVFVDFGNCEPEVLGFLIEHLKKSKLKITKIGFV